MRDTIRARRPGLNDSVTLPHDPLQGDLVEAGALEAKRLAEPDEGGGY
jgi:hypothetical protein